MIHDLTEAKSIFENKQIVFKLIFEQLIDQKVQ